MKAEIEKAFVGAFGREPGFISVEAPGRANLIGEHVDYQGGHVMPMAIDRFMYASGRKTRKKNIRILACNYKEFLEIPLENIACQKSKTWANYLLGVIEEFRKSGYMKCGVEIAFGGNIPAGSGLSSSAALEIATASLLQELFDAPLPQIETIKLARRAENEFAGVNCGIMDQFSTYLGKRGHAIMINCKTLDYRYVPLYMEGNAFILANTLKERKLSASAYNERVASAAKVLEAVKKTEKAEFLADLSFSSLKRYEKKISRKDFRRARHIVEENKRVIKASRLLPEKKMDEFGRLMYQSHKSLKELYEVSCSELDFIVDFAKKFEGVKGARLTGAGMGGCCIILIEKAFAERFENGLGSAYKKSFGTIPAFYPVKPVNGAFYRNSG